MNKSQKRMHGETEAERENYFAAIAEEAEEEWLYNKKHFFVYVGELLESITEDVRYCLLSIDIENLKLFNEWYGRRAGDDLLAGISECLKAKREGKYTAVGYFGNDDFAFFMPYDRQKIEDLYGAITNLLDFYGNKTGFLPAVGIYEITDKTESVLKMYDRASLARASVKGNYTGRIKKFDTKMLERLESNYVLFSDVRRALEHKDFTFFLQPKCNMENGRIMGAEALVRWVSKEKGTISPGVFVPLLEDTGFIAELDPYIWEEVCKWQKGRIERGLQTVPVSVNVSKVDIYSLDVPTYFERLLKEYDLDPRWIEIEITESTYTEDNEFINDTIAKLRESGFRVLMDDFGSGFSSLNMLKDIEIDVMKMDMRFLDINEDNANKGTSIVEAVLNMASLMGIGVIAEGVETEAQKAFLLKMGAGYAQGYYFYRPLSVQDFEDIIENGDNLDFEGFQDKKIEKLYLKDLLGEDMFSEVMINNMLGAVAFYDVFEKQVTLRRYNENYSALISDTILQPAIETNVKAYLCEKEYQKLLQIFDKARRYRQDGAEGDIRRQREDGTDIWLHLRVFFLREQDGHTTYYSSISDATDRYRKNQVLKQQNEALRFLNNDMPGGYYRHKNNADCEFLYISQRFLDIFGYTREEIAEQFDNKFANMIHPDDRILLHQGIEALEQNGGNYSQPYRMRSKNGYIMVTDQSRLVKYDGHEFFQGIILCEIDYYKQLADEENNVDSNHNATNFMPCGVFQYEADGAQQFTYISNSMLAMLGYSRQAFREKFDNCFNNMVYIEDRERVQSQIKEQIQQSNYDSCEYRIEMADGSLKWVYDRGRLTVDVNGKRWFYAAIMDYDYLKEKYREKEWKQEKYGTLAEIPGMIVYDYEPSNDRLTIEVTTEEGITETAATEKFLEGIDAHEWLSPEGMEEQKKSLKAAMAAPISGTTKFKARLAGDDDYRWYRAYFKSLANENGRVYRIVGRVERM